MQLTIHRGTHQIGGSCLELNTKESSILIDFGLPLPDKNNPIKVNNLSIDELTQSGIIPKINRLFKTTGFDAVLISHAHPDHYGLLPYINKDIPIYASNGTKILIDLNNTFFRSKQIPGKITSIKPWESFIIKDITVTPYLVDHSGFDALSFLIEAEGKRIFYTGDFRAHGRKGILFRNLIKHPPKNIDYLITEGTMLSREDEIYKTEEDIEHELVKRIKAENNLKILSCSSQNIDRLVSIYRACIKTETDLVLDPYTAYILYKLKDVSNNIPQFDWPNIKIFFLPNRQTKIILDEKKMFFFKKAKITIDEILDKKNRIVIKDSFTMRSILKNKGVLSGSTLIYSQWEGYFKDIEQFWLDNNVNVIKLHASGHSYSKDIQKLIHAIKPKNIIPVHTEYPEKFSKITCSKILFPIDGEVIQL